MKVPYASWLRDQMSDAFDAYLWILRSIKEHIDNRLGRSSPNWRMQNSCPCCNYKVSGIHICMLGSHFTLWTRRIMKLLYILPGF